MNIVKLRRLIREEIECQLDGESSSVEETTFEDFRAWFGNLLHEAGQFSLANVLFDLGDTKNPFISNLWECWSDMRLEGEQPTNEQVVEAFAMRYSDVCARNGLNESKIRRIIA